MKPFKKQWPLGCLLVLGFAAAASAQTASFFQPFDALHSCALGITPSGDMAGWYDQLISPPGQAIVTKRHGWVFRRGVWTSFDPPGAAVVSMVVGIDPQGHVTGYLGEGTPTIYKGFLMRNGQFTILEYPGALDTFATGLNMAGDIVGWYRNLLDAGPPRQLSRNFGFLLTRDGDYKILEPPLPDLTGVQLWGINTRGDVVGQYARADGYWSHAFLLTKDGRLTTFDPPDMAPPCVSPPCPIAGWGRGIAINSEGDVSGDYLALAGSTTKTRSFLWRNGVLQSYDLEGGISTGGRGITPSGWVVGCSARVNDAPPPTTRTWSWIRSPR